MTKKLTECRKPFVLFSEAMKCEDRSKCRSKFFAKLFVYWINNKISFLSSLVNMFDQILWLLFSKLNLFHNFFISQYFLHTVFQLQITRVVKLLIYFTCNMLLHSHVDFLLKRVYVINVTKLKKLFRLKYFGNKTFCTAPKAWRGKLKYNDKPENKIIF